MKKEESKTTSPKAPECKYPRIYKVIGYLLLFVLIIPFGLFIFAGITVGTVICVGLIIASCIFMVCASHTSCTFYNCDGQTLLLYIGLINRYIKLNGVKVDDLTQKEKNSYSILYGCILDDGKGVEVLQKRTGKVLGVKVDGKMLPRIK